MSYTIRTDTGILTRDEDGATIPQTKSNRDFREYEDWVREGGETNVIEVVPKESTADIRRKEYADNARGTSSMNELITVALEVIVLELNQRGEPVTDEFRELTTMVNNVRQKVSS